MTCPTTTHLGFRWGTVKHRLLTDGARFLALLDGTSDAFQAECGQQVRPHLYLSSSDGILSLAIAPQGLAVGFRVKTGYDPELVLPGLHFASLDADRHWSIEIADAEELADALETATASYRHSYLLQFAPGWDPALESVEASTLAALTKMRGDA